MFAGILRRGGEIWVDTGITFMSFFGIRVPLAAYLSSMPFLGSRGIWMAIALSFAFGCFANGGYYATGSWKRKELIRPSAVEQSNASIDTSKAKIESMEAAIAEADVNEFIDINRKGEN